MNLIETLREQRKKYLDGLEANKNDINLDVLDDFYPDKAHFIYELLQNAEDAEAPEVNFRLSSDGVCQRCCPPILCGVSDFRDAGFAFRVEPDGSGGLPVSGFA